MCWIIEFPQGAHKIDRMSNRARQPFWESIIKRRVKIVTKKIRLTFLRIVEIAVQITVIVLSHHGIVNVNRIHFARNSLKSNEMMMINSRNCVDSKWNSFFEIRSNVRFGSSKNKTINLCLRLRNVFTVFTDC